MPRLPQRIGGIAAAALLGAALLAAPLASAQQSTPSQAMPAPAPAAAPMPSAAASGSTAPAHAPRSARVETRIKSLHTQLKITSDQEDKWNAVADAMRDNAATLDQLAQERAAGRTKMSAVDDLQSYEKIADAHADGLKKLVPAFSTLYDSMSDAQKKNADKIFGNRVAAKRTTTTAKHS
jgi:protein CpxP